MLPRFVNIKCFTILASRMNSIITDQSFIHLYIEDCVSIVPRNFNAWILSSMFLPSAFYISSESLLSTPEIYQAFENYHILAMIIYATNAAIHIDSSRLNVLLCATACSLFTIFAMLQSYQVQLESADMSVIMSALYVIVLVIMAAVFCRRMYFTCLSYPNFKSFARDVFGFNLALDEVVFIVVFVNFLCFYGINIAVKMSIPGFDWTEQTTLQQQILISNKIFFTSIMLVIPGRIIWRLASLREQLLDQKRAFVRYVSHEIRSPLNVAMAGLDIAKDHDGDVYTETMRELVGDSYTACQSAVNMINDLLQYESMDAGSLKIDVEQKIMYRIFGDKIKMLRTLAKKNKVNFYVHDNAHCVDPGSLSSSSYDTSKLYMVIDTNKVDQVIRNLVTNSMKFTPAGGSVTIRTNLVRDNADSWNIVNNLNLSVAEKPAGVLRFEVIDTGKGISAENQKKVFGEFAQFDANENQAGGGSGLGLMISKRIIHLHGGSLSFHSAGLGQGSTFFFDLPVYAFKDFRASIRSEVSERAKNSFSNSISLRNSVALSSLQVLREPSSSISGGGLSAIPSVGSMHSNFR